MAGKGSEPTRKSAQVVSMGMYGSSQLGEPDPSLDDRWTIPASIRNILPVFSMGIGSCDAVVASAIG